MKKIFVFVILACIMSACSGKFCVAGDIKTQAQVEQDAAKTGKK
jgi:hypothetical protein